MYAYVGVLVANKIDLDNRRLISEAQGRQFAILRVLNTGILRVFSSK